MTKPSSTLNRALSLSTSVLRKYRQYVADPSQAPEGVHVEQGKRGGYSYETSARNGHQGAPPRRDRRPPTQPASGRSHRVTPEKTRTPDPAHWDPKRDGDTEAVWRNPDGTWKPERQATHRKILAQIFEGVPAVENPTLYLMGGGSGSGKSVFLKSNKSTVPSKTQSAHIDADDIKAQLPEWEGLLGAKNASAAAICHEESSYLSKLALRMAAERSTHAVLDGTGDSTVQQLKKKVAEFRDRGMRVVANYCTLPMDLALSNVEKRGQRTGRFVPPSVVKQIHRDVSRVLPEALQAGLFDECALYDTSTLGQPKPILSQQGGKLQIHEPELWQAFLDKGQDEPDPKVGKAVLNKYRRYIANPGEAPEGVEVVRTPRGKFYYETEPRQTGPSVAATGRRKKQPVDPFHESMVTAPPTSGWYRKVIYEAKAASAEAPGYSEARAEVNRIWEALKEIDGQAVRDGFQRSGIAGDRAKLKQVISDAEAAGEYVRVRLKEVFANTDAPFSNSESLLLDEIRRYAAMTGGAANDFLKELNRAHLPPALRLQAELQDTLFAGKMANPHPIKDRNETAIQLSNDLGPGGFNLFRNYVQPNIGRLPEAHLATIFTMTSEPYAAGERESGQALAQCNMNTGKITLFFNGSNSSERYKVGSVAHEIGHAVHGALLRARHLYTTESNWEAAGSINEILGAITLDFRTARTKAGLPEEPSSPDSLRELNAVSGRSVLANAPSDYSLTNEKEWLAEQYEDYVYYPMRLKQNQPATYDALKKIFGGIEYHTSHAVPVHESENLEGRFEAFDRGKELDAHWGAVPLQ